LTSVANQDPLFNVPESVTAVFNQFFICEMTTIGKTGRPMIWPVMPLYWPERGQFVLFTSIGLPQKAYNVKQNPHVSLLFSDPTGSNLVNPPTVLVQGNAAVADEIITSFNGLELELCDLLKRQTLQMRQPSMKLYVSSALTRYLMDWYFMRLVITFTLTRIIWWETDDNGQEPVVQEVNHAV
jgi:hypothetical protein